MNDYSQLPLPPELYSAANVCVRLVDAIGYRYRQSLEGLTEDYRDFSPCEGSMSIHDLQTHIFNLIKWVATSIQSQESDMDYSVENTFVVINQLRENLLGMNDDDFGRMTIGGKSIWSAINGPLADALTHVGQINTYKRIAGIQVAKKGYFL